jgi:hypothetical protein
MYSEFRDSFTLDKTHGDFPNPTKQTQPKLATRPRRRKVASNERKTGGMYGQYDQEKKGK